MARVINKVALLATTLVLSAHAQYSATYDPNNLPATTEQNQFGTNLCGTANNQTSLCQNLWVNSVQDFCVWGPPDPNSTIGNVEQIVVAYCAQGGRGTRLLPEGTLTSAHFIETPDYIQVTGTGIFTNINIQAGDGGGELDPHGPDGFGNPHGGLVFSTVWDAGTNGLGSQIHEWTNFMSDTEFCIRVCKETDPQKTSYCGHVYDTLGCEWNMPGNYGPGFDNCMADSVIPMGLYPQPDGSTSTADPHPTPVPPAQSAAATSSCTPFTSANIYTSAPPAPSSTGAASASASVHTGSSTGSSGSRATSSTPAPTHSTGGASALGLPSSLLLTFVGMFMGVNMLL